MTVYVLDTGAVIVLLDKSWPRRPLLWKVLEDAVAIGDHIVLPTLVIAEVGQTKEPPKKRLEELLKLATPYPIDRRIAERAARGLRAINRVPCEKCSGLRPGLVDAFVMAIAAGYVENQDRATVYTQDREDFEVLLSSFPGVDISAP